MGRKAQNKIKVTLQLHEQTYQTLSVLAMKLGHERSTPLCVSDYISELVTTKANDWLPIFETPLTKPSASIKDIRDAPTHPVDALNSNADSRTEDEPRKEKKKR